MYECNQAHRQLATKTCQTLRGDRIDQGCSSVLSGGDPACPLGGSSLGARFLASLLEAGRSAMAPSDRAGPGYRGGSLGQGDGRQGCQRPKTIVWWPVVWNANGMRNWPKRRKTGTGICSGTQTSGSLAHGLATRADPPSDDLPAVFHAPTTTFAQRKQLLCWLIKDVMLSKRGNVIDVAIRWQTEALTRLTDATKCRGKNARPAHRWSSARGSRSRCTPLHKSQALLNEEGERAGMGGSLTVSKIEWICYAITSLSRMSRASESRTNWGNGEMGATQLEPQQTCSMSMSRPSRTGARAGILQSVRSTPLGPRWITLTPEIIAALRKPVRRQWKQRRTRNAGECVIE